MNTWVGDYVTVHTVGEVTVVTGLGGIFAVESTGSTEAPVLSAVHGEPMFDDDNFVCALQDRTQQRRGTYHPDLFEPGVVRRLPAERLPAGVTDADTRRWSRPLNGTRTTGPETRTGFTIEVASEHPPKYLLDGSRYGEFPT